MLKVYKSFLLGPKSREGGFALCQGQPGFGQGTLHSNHHHNHHQHIYYNHHNHDSYH